MATIGTSWKAWPVAFVQSMEANDSMGATRTLLERARMELEKVGANKIKETGPMSFRFARKWFSWGSTWMQHFSGEVRVEPSGGRLVVSIQTNIGTLLVSGAAFFVIVTLVGLPAKIALAMVAFVGAGNTAIAFFSIRRILSRIARPFVVGAA